MMKFVKLIVRVLKGGCSMDKDIKNFIATRCQEALTENADYMKKERSGKCRSERITGYSRRPLL